MSICSSSKHSVSIDESSMLINVHRANDLKRVQPSSAIVEQANSLIASDTKQ